MTTAILLTSYLPDEICQEILTRLPVKSVIRFRGVSRSWKNMIDHPDFTRLHLDHFNNSSRDSQIVFVQGRLYCECVVKNGETLRTTSSLGFLVSDLNSIHVLRTRQPLGVSFQRGSIISSMDGLFLLHGNLEKLTLWNPLIRKTLVLPPCRLGALAHSFNLGISGLGFDPSIRDYKAVLMLWKPIDGVKYVAVYTLKTNFWKVIKFRGESAKAVHNRWLWSRTVFCNGELHAFTTCMKTEATRLVSFDLASETISFGTLPATQSKNLKHWLTTVDDGGSLALIRVTETMGSVWVLPRSGDDRGTWIQRYTFDAFPAGQRCEYEFMYMKKNDQMLMKWGTKVMCYYLETRQYKIFIEKNRMPFHDTAFEYKESLLLRD